MCPCQAGRAGAFQLVVSLYWAMQCGGIAAMFHLLGAGNGMSIWWAVWTVCGVIELVEGVHAARSHDDNFNPGSVAVSVGLIGLALWALADHWFILGNDWVSHISRVWPFGLLGSEAFNLWLNFRGRRHAAAPPRPVPEARPRRFGPRRRRIEVIEDIEGLGIDADDLARLLANHLGSNTPSLPEHDGAPQIVHVPDENGRLIEIQLPSRVRVRR